MNIRDKIIENCSYSRHFDKRADERNISLKEAINCIKKGTERYLLGEKIKYTLNETVVVVGAKSLSLITVYHQSIKTRQLKNKLGRNKKFNSGTGRSKKKSASFRAKKLGSYD